MLASSAFLASAAATLPLQNAILSEPIKAAEDPGVSSATTTWTSLTQSSIPVEATRQIQKAWDTPGEATVYQKILVDDTNTATDIARLKAAATLHAGDWLHASPITAVGLRLSDEDIRIAVGFRLRSRTCQTNRYLCGSLVDAQGLHGLSCRKSAPRQIRHAQNERYHLEIGEEGAVPGSQGTSVFVEVGWQKTRRRDADPMDERQATGVEHYHTRHIC